MRFVYLLEIEVERESGKFASRDEISEKLESALEDVENFVDLSGLGSDSDSEYNVVQVDFTEKDNKALRALKAEYDDAVKAEEPTNKELKDKLKAANQKIKALESTNESFVATLAKLRETAEQGKTRIHSKGYYQPQPIYLPDRDSDAVLFDLPGGDYDDLAVRVQYHDAETLEIRIDGFAGLSIRPVSSNSFYLKAGEI